MFKTVPCRCFKKPKKLEASVAVPGHDCVRAARDYGEQKQALLFRWNEKLSRRATNRALFKAIYSLKDIELLNSACQLLREQISDCTCSAMAVIPPALIEYQRRLKIGYRTYKPVMVGEWPPPPALGYVELVLVPKEPVQKGEIKDAEIHARIYGGFEDEDVTSEEVNLEELLKPNTDGHKVILFEGSPGSGKSTLL